MTDLSCLPENTGLFFNGAFQNGDGLLTSINPATGEMLMEVSGASEASVNLAVTQASDAQPAWSRADVRERVAFVRKFIDAIEANAHGLATLDSLDTGNPYQGMQIDVKISLAVMDLFARTPS